MDFIALTIKIPEVISRDYSAGDTVGRHPDAQCSSHNTWNREEIPELLLSRFCPEHAGKSTIAKADVLWQAFL